MTVKQILSWDDCQSLVKKLVDKVISHTRTPILNIYGIPRGGQFVALMLSQLTKLPLSNEITDNSLIVDDVADSGQTLSKYYKDNRLIKGVATATLHVKPWCARFPHFYVSGTEDYIIYPWEAASNETIENNVTRILECIGENPNREGLIDTPKRVANMYKQLFRGYDPNKKPIITVFQNGRDGVAYDQMIVDEGNFWSTCEHHVLSFFGQYYFGYIPHKEGRVLGLSKIARVVDYFSARLQIQERLVAQIVDALWTALDDGVHPPLGMILVMKAKHLCKSMRGVQKEGFMTASEVRGVFKDKSEPRAEFFELIKLQGEKT